MTEKHDVVVVGAGQAGLSISHELTQHGVEHVVLERGHIGESWRGRWDTFCLVLPNWTVRLAGKAYDGSDPDGFMVRDEIVSYLALYAESFAAPVREGISVSSLQPDGGAGFRLQTSAGDMSAREVVVASGGFQRPHHPAGVDHFPSSLPVIDVENYRNPQTLPPGKVLVIGSAQTGCQIAEDLRLTGREVYLACGRAPWMPRRIEGRDMFSWLSDTPFINQTLADLPSPFARLGPNPQTSGRDGGHDLNYRTLQAQGVTLVGRFVGVDDGKAHFASDLEESVAFGDARYDDMRKLIAASCVARGVRAPEMAPPPPFNADPPDHLDVRDFSAVVITSGFRPAYESWIHCPGAFDQMGFPLQTDGSSTVVPGLHFMGVIFQRTRVSATLLGVGLDAGVLAQRIGETTTAQSR